MKGIYEDDFKEPLTYDLDLQICLCDDRERLLPINQTFITLHMRQVIYKR